MGKKSIVYVLTLVVVIMALAISLVVTDKNSNITAAAGGIQVLDEVILTDNTNDIIEDKSNSTLVGTKGEGRVINPMKTDRTENVVNGTNDEHLNAIYTKEIDPCDIIKQDMEKLKSGDRATVLRYFGDSVVFSPDNIIDKLAATVISFASVKNNHPNTYTVVVHICTLDYQKMNQDMLRLKETIDDEKQISKEIAKGVVNGLYELHYTIPLTVENNCVIVTEEFKQSITGGWYTGIGTNLKSVDCIATVK